MTNKKKHNILNLCIKKQKTKKSLMLLYPSEAVGRRGGELGCTLELTASLQHPVPEHYFSGYVDKRAIL